MPKQIDFDAVISKLKSFYARAKRLPSFSELQKIFRYRSKGGVSRLVDRLEEMGIVKQDGTGRLIPTPRLTSGLRVLGSVEAGFPSPAEEELVDTLSLDDFLIRKPDASYLLKVSGDSMIGAGIHPDDLVIVRVPGATLVLPRGRAADLKRMLATLPVDLRELEP